MPQAFCAIRLIRGSHYEFECITCFNNFLLVGTKSGQILIYEITSVANHPDYFIPTFSTQDQSLRKIIEFTPLETPPNESSNFLPTLNVRLRATHNLCKKPILQLQAVPEYGFFLALTENQLAAHALSNRQLISVVPNSRGATHFTVIYQSPKSEPQNHLNADHSVYRFKKIYTDEVRLPSDGSPMYLNLCICVKRKLYFFRWVPSKSAFVYPSETDDPSISFWPSEYAITEPAKLLHFCGLQTLLIALRYDYMRLNLVTRVCQRISVAARLGTTIMSPLPYCLDPITFSEVRSPKDTPLDITAAESDSGKWVIGGSAPFAIFSDDRCLTLMPEDEDVQNIPVCMWSDSVQCFQVLPPYLFAGLPKRLEVRSLDPCVLVQTFLIPRVRSMCCNEYGWLYASATASIYHPDDLQPCLSPDEGEVPSVGTGSDVWLLISANRLRLVQKLVKNNEFRMALRVASFTKISGQKSIETNQIGALFAFHLFNTDRDFEGAFQLFYKLKTDPTLVIGLCPGLLNGDETTERHYPSPLVPLSDSEKTGIFEPLIAFLVRWRNHLRSNYPHGMNLTEFLEQHILCGGMYRDVEYRQRRSLLELIDTCLLKCYQATNVARIGPLLRQENYCSLEEAEKILKDNNCIKDLVTMYRIRGLHHEALHFLTSCVSNVGKENNVPKSEQPSYQDVVNYFKQLNGAPFELVAEFGEDILMQHPRAWMSIFTTWERQIRRDVSTSRKEYDSLLTYRDKAMRYLEHLAPHLLIPFLECILFGSCVCENEEEEGLDALDMLHEEDDFDPIVSLDGSPSSFPMLKDASNSESISILQPEVSTSESSDIVAKHWESTCIWPFPRHCYLHHRSTHRHVESESDVNKMPEICPSSVFPLRVHLFNRYVRAILRQIRLNTEGKVIAYRVADEKPADGIVARLRSRLLQFLSMEEVEINAEDLLPHFPYDGCFEERAVLLARLKRHRQALTLWVHLLDSWDKALAYCARIQAEVEQQFTSGGSSKTIKAINEANSPHEIYTLLVDICLHPLEPISLGIILPNNTKGAEASELSSSECNLQFKPRTDLALAVMLRFGDLIDVTKVLHMIPDNANVKSVSFFLESALRRQANLRTRLVFFTDAVLKESVESRNACVKTTAAQMFQVTPLSRCRQCRRRIGTAAFVRYPDTGELVHYGCCRDLPVNSSPPVLQY